MDLQEWRQWWERSGRKDLRHLLRKNWDVVRDSPEVATDEFLLRLAHRLRDGASATEVREVLAEVRQETQGPRFGRKWHTRDQRVAEKIFVWYVEGTR